MAHKRSSPTAAVRTAFFPTKRWPRFARVVSRCAGWKTAFRSGGPPDSQSLPVVPDADASRSAQRRSAELTSNASARFHMADETRELCGDGIALAVLVRVAQHRRFLDLGLNDVAVGHRQCWFHRLDQRHR